MRQGTSAPVVAWIGSSGRLAGFRPHTLSSPSQYAGWEGPDARSVAVDDDVEAPERLAVAAPGR